MKFKRACRRVSMRMFVALTGMQFAVNVSRISKTRKGTRVAPVVLQVKKLHLCKEI